MLEEGELGPWRPVLTSGLIVRKIRKKVHKHDILIAVSPIYKYSSIYGAAALQNILRHVIYITPIRNLSQNAL